MDAFARRTSVGVITSSRACDEPDLMSAESLTVQGGVEREQVRPCAAKLVDLKFRWERCINESATT